jgi:tetratricopeptide (TPR) repeat protein
LNLSVTDAESFRFAMIAARSGRLLAARECAETILLRTNGGGVVPAFLGMVCCQSGDITSGIDYLRAAIRLNPSDLGSVANLVTALIDSGATNEALDVCTAEIASRDHTARLWGLRGYLLQSQELFGQAAIAYEKVVGISPNDVDAWNNLGNARVGAGDHVEGIAALHKAMELRPDVAAIRINLAGALIDAQQVDEALEVLSKSVRDFADDATLLVELAALFHQLDRHKESLDAIERASRIAPDDADMLVRLGEQRLINWVMDGAEEAFYAAIALAPEHREARLQLGILFEQSNRIAELRSLVAESVAAGTDAGIVKFLRVLLLRREQRFEEGLQVLKTVPINIDAAKRGQLEGEFLDRLGDVDGAFAAFSDVNATLRADQSQPMARAALYRSQIETDAAVVTKQWYQSWVPVHRPLEHAAPVFLVGFPRSGTTLLDTILMGHPNLQVLEERPVLRSIADKIGHVRNLSTLDTGSINQYRKNYYEELTNYIDYKSDKTLIDKFPLYLNKIPAIARIFPESKFILSIRHPYDVALSCFITSFRLNNAMSNFLDMQTIVDTYNLTFSFWERCRSIFPMQVHTTLYENVVSNKEYELERLAQFLNLDPDVSIEDHQKVAFDRGMISTASYSQVMEPIYERGAGRWQRYKKHMGDVIEKLEPWVHHWGYAT